LSGERKMSLIESWQYATWHRDHAKVAKAIATLERVLKLRLFSLDDVRSASLRAVLLGAYPQTL